MPPGGGWTRLRTCGPGDDDACATRHEKRCRRLEPEGGTFHNLRTRRAGARRFAFVELRVPGDWSVERADAVARAAEQAASERDVTLMVRVTPTAIPGKAHGAR